ncbi:unannotated protein [freshwater metagenome]|uniref:Unannotated protein n=1 Tax=freshwater metagenome TaxID=449393 RepID=A0A6J7GZ42_9ZZZZ
MALFVLSAFLSGGLGGGLIGIGLLVLAAGAWALLRGRLHGLGIASRRAAAGVAAAGFVVTGIGGSLAPAADAEPLPAQAAVATTTAPAPTTSRPSATRPVQAAPTTTAAPTTRALPPAPVMSMTCPGAGSGASPVYLQQISATGPYQVTIDYGDGDVYTNDDQNLAAVFSHRYLSAGTFVVQAVLTDVAGQTASASCLYTWTAPVAPAPAPVVGSTGGGSTGGSSGGGVSGVVPGGGASYANCTEVKAAGAAPIYPGDPGWQEKFDRDNDGVGCES